MTDNNLPKILIVDDEEAILETMTFTFMDEYEVLSTSDPTKAMGLLEENDPIAVVITDQRMPGMTGVDLLKQVYERFPATIRIILTGFADSEATVKAINDGHIYGYINKPWEPDELKTIVKRASELHTLTLQNLRLVDDLRDANLFLEGVMDRLRTGAIAIDRDGIIRAVNRPAVAFLGLSDDVRGRGINDVMSQKGLEDLSESIRVLAQDSGGSFEEVDVPVGKGHRVRISSQSLVNEAGEAMGRVVLFKEISHEPLTRKFEEIVDRIAATKGPLREALEGSQKTLEVLGLRVREAGVESANMLELGERVSRTRTAMSNWLDVDETLANEDYPDVQMLRDRLLVASKRWPRSDELPQQVVALSQAVEAYYESGENPRHRVL